ncbi:DUF2024 family protein [Pseudoalteromonas sp. SSM20]|uniref:DUF2024 family protein n=1 Tax=Pseudoalteromonas sp. SSM20 TaxID=3139394 RepID=UPI003BA8FA63
MQVHIYDTHVTTNNGHYLHFDVLVDDANVSKVKQFAEQYLKANGIEVSQISQSRCQFCHSEIANPETIQKINQQGHAIIELVGV